LGSLLSLFGKYYDTCSSKLCLSLTTKNQVGDKRESIVDSIHDK
jgi:hypothetical protein